MTIGAHTSQPQGRRSVIARPFFPATAAHGAPLQKKEGQKLSFMRKEKMRHKLINRFLILLSVVLALLWLKEWNQRAARESADRFMGLFVTQFHCVNMKLYPWSKDSSGKLHGPTWIATYDSYFFLVDFPPEIHVNLLGQVIDGCNLKGMDDWVRLSEEERLKAQMDILVKHEMRFNKTPNNRVESTNDPGRQTDGR